MFGKWTTPRGQINNFYIDGLNQYHLLIAGATGSGKSVIVNGLIYTALYQAPTNTQFILIDPKRVELSMYRSLPHTITYASEPDTMVDALYQAMDITETRYQEMQKRGIRKYTGSNIYIIIDEFADLMTTNKRAVKPLIQRLAQIGRAARVHIWLCTQTPISAILPTEIKCNFDSRIGLRTRSAQDSRNILGMVGLETLPMYGECVYMTPKELSRYYVPFYNDSILLDRVRHWTRQKRFFGLF